MITIYGTENNDTIDATYSNGTSWGDSVKAGDGDDTVKLGPGVSYFSEPGNDTISAEYVDTYAGSIVVYEDPSPSVIDLANGKMYDAYGGIDNVSDITEVHFGTVGGTLYGSSLNEVIFISGGNAKLYLGSGQDTVRVWEQQSSTFKIETAGASTFLFRNNETIEIKGAERIEFSDKTLIGNFRENAENLIPELQYQTHTWKETEFSEGWWYAGVYYEPQLVNYYPLNVSPIDIGNDGDLDMIIPMSRGYRTGVDTRYNFQVLENINGTLTYSEAKTTSSPFVTGARRTDEIYLHSYGSNAFVTIAHDTAIETETRWDIPWRYGDLTVTVLETFQSVAADMLTNVSLPSSTNTGRATSVDAHSMAIGDINHDGMDDILIGEFHSETYGLLQTANGQFEMYSSSLLPSFSSWKEPTSSNDTQTFVVTANQGKFYIDGQSQATLDLVKGKTYVFDLSQVSTAHPFRLSTSENGPTAYTNGVTVTGVQGTAGAKLTFVVPDGAPSTLYYFCTNHLGMGSSMAVGNTTSSSSLLIDLHMEDFNGDGKDDIVAGWGHGPAKSRLFFNSENGFTSENSVTLPSAVYGDANSLHLNTWSEDFDGDGDQDLIINQSRHDPYYGGTYLQFLLNDGSGNFTDETSLRLVDPQNYKDTYGERLQWTDLFSILDIDGDGDLDITGRYVDYRTPTPIIFKNDGTGHFELIEIPSSSDTPYPLSWSDFDGDGKLEYVTFRSNWANTEQTEMNNWFEVYELGSSNLNLVNQYYVGGQILSRSDKTMESVVVNGKSTTSNGTWEVIVSKGDSFSSVIDFQDSNLKAAVSSQDALEALRLSVGLQTSSGTSSAYDYIAADINKDNKVNASDALEILKYSVGLNVNNSADWVFIDNSTDLTSITKNNVNYNEGVSLNNISSDTTVNLTAILLGDVNDTSSGFIA